MKLAIGSAQFGFNYSLTGSEIKDDKEVESIIDYAREIGINTIDTAIGYGLAERRLGRVGISGFKIITKLPKIDPTNNISQYIEDEIYKSLENLNVESLYGLLLHNPSDILSSQKNTIIDTIEKLKENKIIKNFGYSLYQPEEIDRLEETYYSDMLQVPYNLFDRRFENVINTNLKNIKSKKIYVRSIFLRGILLQKNPSSISNYFSHWDNIFLRWKEWLIQNDVDPLLACVNYIKNNHKIERAIVGIDCLKQLKSIYSAYTSEQNIYPINSFVSDLNLLDPRRWKL